MRRLEFLLSPDFPTRPTAILASAADLRRGSGVFSARAADKALMLALFVSLAWFGDVPFWLAITAVSRDVLILFGVSVAVMARAPIEIRPRFPGKVTTALEVLYIGWHLAWLAF